MLSKFQFSQSVLQQHQHQDCGIWLAPSTIKGAGLGIYAGREYAAQENLQPVGDAVIPIVDIEYHVREYDSSSSNQWQFLWDDYIWNANSLNLDHEGLYTVYVASFGLGAVTNCFLALSNVDEGEPRCDAAGLHRSTDPGAGAFTLYYDRTFTAKRNIQAGEEFFVSYGEKWFRSRPQLGPVPLLADLDLATDLIRAFQRLNLRQSISEELWDIFVRNSLFRDKSRILGAFQHDDNYKEELQQLRHYSMKELRVKQSSRSLAWLAEHGTCGDHLYVRPSTIPQAGRGAFASRFLPAGTVVAPMPLIHVTDRNRFTMYNLANVDGKRKPSRERGILGYQLLLNYCFGHAESTILLCPYGPMTNYINHNANQANVELRWADPSRSNHRTALLNDTMEALDADPTAKLAFELVAKRDILSHEEVFLDYGTAWEQAWLKHVAFWEPAGKDYVPAWQLNQDIARIIRTVFDEIEQPRYPRNVELRCNTALTDYDKTKWEALTMAGFLKENGEAVFLPCEVLRYRIKDGEMRYTVLMWTIEKGETKPSKYFLQDIPRIGLVFVDKPYTSDLSLPTAFRHDIRIPDRLFPVTWKNLKQSTSTQ